MSDEEWTTNTSGLASRASELTRVCEWCGRTDCEDMLRGGPTASGHEEAVRARESLSHTGDPASLRRSQSERQGRRATGLARGNAGQGPRLRRAATVGRNANSRSTQGHHPGRSHHLRTWHFRNSASISWTYPSQRSADTD